MKTIKQSLLSIAVGLVLAAGISYASAWIGATKDAPLNNADTPINVSANSQTKEGPLTVGGLFQASGAAMFKGDVIVGAIGAEKNLTVNGAVKVDTFLPARTVTTVPNNVCLSSGLYKVCSFTTTTGGTFTLGGGLPDVPLRVEYLIVGGGGAGGSLTGGGGGGGGVLAGSAYLLPGPYPVVVGVGGTGVAKKAGGKGGDSSFGSIAIAKGGGGGGVDGTNGGDGGSGGGGAGNGNNTFGTGVSGQGFNGGIADWSSQWLAGGGGGAGGPGGNGSNKNGNGGNGGNGKSSSITGLFYGGGGGGGVYTGTAGAGGSGGGGAGARNGNSVSGAINTGGGGGGDGGDSSNAGANGGSGVVIIKYLTADLDSKTISVFSAGAGGLTVTGQTKTDSLAVAGQTTTQNLTATGQTIINRGLQILNGAGNNKVLTSDGSGNAVWKSLDEKKCSVQ